MSRPIDNNDGPLSLDTAIDEDRVRRALGLKTGGAPHQQRPEQARQRHRFVTDGSVPVVMLNRADGETSGLKERLGAAEHTLEIERAAHANVRRTLSEAQAAHQALQTRFGHTELALNETIKTEREARRAAEELVAALRAEIAALKEAPPPAPAPAAVPAAPRREVRAIEPIRKPRATKEPKPVRWWTPSYRAKQR